MKDVAFVQTGLFLRHRSILSGIACSSVGIATDHVSAASSLWRHPSQELLWTGNLGPPAVAFRRQKCTILWLRLGHFRLADNEAVAAAVQVRGSLLPVVTVQAGQLNSTSLAAICALKRSLEKRGSTAVLRATGNCVQSEVHAVCQVASAVFATEVILNGSRDLGLDALAIFRASGVRVPAAIEHAWVPSETRPCVDNQPCPLLADAPARFPRVPLGKFSSSSSNLSVEGHFAKGEMAARTRLAQLVASSNTLGNEPILLSAVLSLLSEELRLGCISVARLVYEVKGQQPLTTWKRHGVTHQIREAFFTRFFRAPAVSALSIAAYDVNGGDRRGVEWDEDTKSFLLKEWEHAETERRMNPKERWNEFWRRRRMFFKRSFFPDDVTPDYYSFTAWRFAQRCVSATIGVFGTSSLLFALGIRSGRIGEAAVISWVLKDGLGRVGKMIWAGSMGKDFDVDPKRWRFRSALLYALGNGLEIVTQIFPASFLVFATFANSMKQVSMLTSSATRNAMYRSFGGRSQNIANITAKGEAQIVVADLIGMGCGIRLSKVLAKSKKNILGAYLVLTVLDIFGIYMELRQVVFRTLNAERSNIIVKHYIQTGQMLTPADVSPQESIFMRPRYKNRVRMTSIAKAAKDPDELEVLLKVFRREHFLVSVSRVGSVGPCRLVLRKNASNEDVLRAMLMVGYVQKSIKNYDKKKMTLGEQEGILQSSRKSANRNFSGFMGAARSAGWSTENLLFSTMKRRGYWGRERS